MYLETCLILSVFFTSESKAGRVEETCPGNFVDFFVRYQQDSDTISIPRLFV